MIISRKWPWSKDDIMPCTFCIVLCIRLTKEQLMYSLQTVQLWVTIYQALSVTTKYARPINHILNKFVFLQYTLYLIFVWLTASDWQNQDFLQEVWTFLGGNRHFLNQFSGSSSWILFLAPSLIQMSGSFLKKWKVVTVDFLGGNWPLDFEQFEILIKYRGSSTYTKITSTVSTTMIFGLWTCKWGI